MLTRDIRFSDKCLCFVCYDYLPVSTRKSGLYVFQNVVYKHLMLMRFMLHQVDDESPQLAKDKELAFVLCFSVFSPSPVITVLFNESLSQRISFLSFSFVVCFLSRFPSSIPKLYNGSWSPLIYSVITPLAFLLSTRSNTYRKSCLSNHISSINPPHPTLLHLHGWVAIVIVATSRPAQHGPHPIQSSL